MRAFRIAVWLLVGWSAVARAQTASTGVPTRPLWIGGSIGVLASGSFILGSSLQNDTSLDLGSTAIVEGVVDYRVSRLVSIGIAPRWIPSVQPQGLTGSGSQWDLRARLTVGSYVAPRIRLYGIGHAGYSFLSGLYVESTPDGGTTTATVRGPVLGGGFGLAYTIDPRFLFTAELSYEWGYQGTTDNGMDVRARDDLLTLSVGVVAGFGE